MSIENSYDDPNPEKQNMDSPQEEFIDSEARPSLDKSSLSSSSQTRSDISETQKQTVIVIPPTHEQSNPLLSRSKLHCKSLYSISRQQGNRSLGAYFQNR
jgi:hypothetical protein